MPVKYGGASCRLLESSSMRIPCPEQDSNLFSRTMLVVRASLPYPHTCPHGGDTLAFESVLCSQAFCRGLAAWQHPRLRSVLWLARRVVGGSRARQKPPSSLTRKRVPDGRVYEFRRVKDTMSFRRVKRVRTSFRRVWQ